MVKHLNCTVLVPTRHNRRGGHINFCADRVCIDFGVGVTHCPNLQNQMTAIFGGWIPVFLKTILISIVASLAIISEEESVECCAY